MFLCANWSLKAFICRDILKELDPAAGEDQEVLDFFKKYDEKVSQVR